MTAVHGIPRQYAFLSAIGLLPRVITEGLSLLGTNEVPGAGSNAVIESWARELNIPHGSYSDDSVPWCGLFVAICCKRAGKPVVPNPLWARNWASYGSRIDGSPALGDILVFSRGGGGHVGFYIADDETHLHVLGGNQGDAVTIAQISKARLLATRRPPMTVMPRSVRPYRISPEGTISVNEA